MFVNYKRFERRAQAQYLHRTAGGQTADGRRTDGVRRTDSGLTADGQRMGGELVNPMAGFQGAKGAQRNQQEKNSKLWL